MIKLTYLAVDLGSLLFPALLSFSRRWGADRREWARTLAAIILAAVPFLAWDMAFTREAVWGFNARYLLGPRILGLPLEEALFFFCVPFACLFIYRILRRDLRPALPAARLRPIFIFLAAGAALTALCSGGRAYSLSVFALAAGALAWMAVRPPSWSGPFLASALVHYLPFLAVNGILTALPVVVYRESAILGARIGSIPVEDAAYSLLLLLANVALYEALGPAVAAHRPAAAAERREEPASAQEGKG